MESMTSSNLCDFSLWWSGAAGSSAVCRGRELPGTLASGGSQSSKLPWAVGHLAAPGQQGTLELPAAMGSGGLPELPMAGESPQLPAAAGGGEPLSLWAVVAGEPPGSQLLQAPKTMGGRGILQLPDPAGLRGTPELLATTGPWSCRWRGYPHPSAAVGGS